MSKFKSAASFSTKSCQLSVNTTDHFSKVLYSGGEDVTYSSVADFMSALTDGSFALGMLPTQTFVPVRTHSLFGVRPVKTAWIMLCCCKPIDDGCRA